MNQRSEIKGSVRAAYTALLRARCALSEGMEDHDCMLTPIDMDETRKTVRDMNIVLKDIREINNKFGTVADARKALI